MTVSDGEREEKRVTDSAFAFFLSETINYLFDTPDLPPNNCTPPSLFYVPMVSILEVLRMIWKAHEKNEVKWQETCPFQLSRSLTQSRVPPWDLPGVLGMDPAPTGPSRTIAPLVPWNQGWSPVEHPPIASRALALSPREQAAGLLSGKLPRLWA